MAVIGQPKFSHRGADMPKKVACGANTHHYEGLAGAAWLPVALYVLPLSPKDHPTMAQGSPRVVGGHPEIMSFQPTHAGLKTAQFSPVGPQGGGGGVILENWRQHLEPPSLVGGSI